MVLIEPWETTMLRRTALLAAVAAICLSAVYISVPLTPANAAAVRAVANVKVREASKLRKPASAQRDLGKYNRMFEMY
jgi:hypothetical protein